MVDYGSSIIDADIVKHDNLYHMFLAGIWKVTAPDLKGPWSPLDKTRNISKQIKSRRTWSFSDK